LDDKIVWDLLKIVSFFCVNFFVALAALVFVVATQFFDLEVRVLGMGLP
jgi:hypothetical protein